MAITDLKIESFANPVATMPDRPAMEGWSVQMIKERFDSNAEALRQSLNGLIDHVDEKDSTNKTAIENKVDKEDGKGLSANSYTDEDKALVKTVSSKADKTNVIEKNSTSAFTPTEDTHPANKGYVDKTVNEKLKEVGAGDMSQEVYDPQGKKLDIFAEIANYLPLTGGELVADGGVMRVYPESNAGTIASYKVGEWDTKRRAVSVNNEAALASAVHVSEVIDGNYKEYPLFGSHNKPNGTYTGDGNSAKREISIGGHGAYGLLHITCGAHNSEAIVGAWGGIAWSGTTVVALPSGQIKFYTGKLTIQTTSQYFNTSGKSYVYNRL